MLVHRVDELRLSPGTIVGITNAKERIFIAQGYRDSASADPITRDTIFEIGSITKLFTALLLADMTQRGEVNLNEPVVRLLPSGVSVLISQQTRNYLFRPCHTPFWIAVTADQSAPRDSDDPYAHYTANQLYEFLGEYELSLTPGDVYTYSNVGAGLLGHALALRSSSVDYKILVRD